MDIFFIILFCCNTQTVTNIPYTHSNLPTVDKIDQVIKQKEILISELEACKKSAIYEYVTGKKEVPNAY